MILSYKAEINIGVDNKGQSGTISYNLGNGETVVDYRLQNIKTVLSDLTGQTDNPLTTLTIQAVLDEGHTGEQRISVSGGSYRIMGYAVSADGTVAEEETNIPIGSDPNNPTRLEFVGTDGKRHRIEIYAQLGQDNKAVSFVVHDAPVGLQLPDITFQANFAATTALNNNDTIKTSAYISGQGDNRAYDEAKGNTDNITVGVVMPSGTNLTKAVDTRYIELDGSITYDVTYTNSGTDRINRVYFYDLIPTDGDIRGSDYDGEVILRSFDIDSKVANSESTTATVYYSTTEYWELYNTVKVFGGVEKADGTIAGMNSDNVEQMLDSGENANHEKLFRPLGHLKNGEFVYDKEEFAGMNQDEITELMSIITGLYVKAENLQQGQTITMQIVVETQDNRADNWYKNIANSWIADTKTLSLTSNKVETQSVSRCISGVVWYDQDLNGIRDDDELRLEGVTATLFKKGDTGYEPCTVDVKGNLIDPVTTGEDGAYSFNDLTAGDYIVAFSGEVLSRFTDETAYQQNGSNDAVTSDGKKIAGGAGGSYAYYIQYSVGDPSMKLHGLKEIGTANLVGGVEAYANQDLGLITATLELPQTGGSGTTSYTAGGLLILCVGSLLMYNKKKRGKEDFASS